MFPFSWRKIYSNIRILKKKPNKPYVMDAVYIYVTLLYSTCTLARAPVHVHVPGLDLEIAREENHVPFIAK